jgi:TANFOR domain-containing protein
MRKVFTLFVLWLTCATASFAQQYPVQVTPQLIPPYTLQVSEYYSPLTAGAEKLRLMLLNRDLQRPQLVVRLRMIIESQSLRIRTREDVVFNPITLVSGTPYYVSPSELAQYFNANNLEFSGISSQQYELEGKLPEGFYSFCFEAIEVQTNQPVSSSGCAFAWMTLNEPPFLNLPARAESITPRNPQNIIFNWTPRHTASPTAAFNTDYIFSIVELTDNDLSPEAAFMTNPPLFTDSTLATTYLYDVTKPQLLPGKKYAWRVQAKAKNGSEDLAMFRNQGYSETWWFTYQNTCSTPLGISATPQGQYVTIQWQPNIQHLEYKVEYREKNNPDAEWFSLTNIQPQVILTDLKPGKLYEYRVGGSCEYGVFNYSDLLSFTTNAENISNVANCGDSSQIPSSVPPNLLQTLNPGDTIRAGDFKVVATQVSGSGSFSGEGYVRIPWLLNIKVAVQFTNITVNTERKLVSGVIETTYDPTESGIIDIDEALGIASELINTIGGWIESLQSASLGSADFQDQLNDFRDQIQQIYDEDIKAQALNIYNTLDSLNTLYLQYQEMYENATTDEEREQALAAMQDLEEQKDQVNQQLNELNAQLANGPKPLTTDETSILKEALKVVRAKYTNNFIGQQKSLLDTREGTYEEEIENERTAFPGNGATGNNEEEVTYFGSVLLDATDTTTKSQLFRKAEFLYNKAITLAALARYGNTDQDLALLGSILKVEGVLYKDYVEREKQAGTSVDQQAQVVSAAIEGLIENLLLEKVYK